MPGQSTASILATPNKPLLNPFLNTYRVNCKTKSERKCHMFLSSLPVILRKQPKVQYSGPKYTVYRTKLQGSNDALNFWILILLYVTRLHYNRHFSVKAAKSAKKRALAPCKSRPNHTCRLRAAKFYLGILFCESGIIYDRPIILRASLLLSHKLTPCRINAKYAPDTHWAHRPIILNTEPNFKKFVHAKLLENERRLDPQNAPLEIGTRSGQFTNSKSCAGYIYTLHTFTNIYIRITAIQDGVESQVIIVLFQRVHQLHTSVL